MSYSVADLSVSRETITKLEVYMEMVSEWNRRTSLVQLKTLDDFWQRHILDSLQLISVVDFNGKKILDIGTGAGIPGMILAIAGVKNITLLDSNTRKCIFLEEVSRKLNVEVTVVNSRCEALPIKDFNVVLSRACTQLDQLLTFMKDVSRETKNPVGYFHKGKNVDEEINEAKKHHNFNYEKIPSITSDESAIVKVSNLQ